MTSVDFTRSTAQGIERITTPYSTTYIVGQFRAVVPRRTINGEHRVQLLDHAQRLRVHFTSERNEAHALAQQLVRELAGAAA